VGRIFTHDGRGTGFYVAPDIVASAYHVLSSDLLVAPFFTTHHMAPSRDIVIRRDRNEGTSFDKLLISVEEHKWLCATDKKLFVNDADPSQKSIRRLANTQNDFNFAFTSKHSPRFLTPYPGDIVPAMPVAVLGYPGLPAQKTLAERASSYYTIHKISPSKLETVFQLFNVKHIACGAVKDVDTTFNRLVTITASTLPGESGAPVVPLADPTTFCGIHIEGWPDANYNISVSVHHPNFVVQYVLHVVPHFNPIPDGVKQYIRKHAALLKKVAEVAELSSDVQSLL